LVVTSWQAPHIDALFASLRSWSCEYSDLWTLFGVGGVSVGSLGRGNGPRIVRSVARWSGSLCVPLTASTLWQKKQVTPLSFCGTLARLSPSVVAP